MNLIKIGLFLIPGVLSRCPQIESLTIAPWQIIGSQDPQDLRIGKIAGARFDEDNSCDARILRAQGQLFSCPETAEIFRNEKNNRKMTIRCGTKEEAPFGSRLFLQPKGDKPWMEIVLSEVLDIMTFPLLFELYNHKQNKAASSLAQGLCSRTADEYAIGIETIEYKTVKDVNAICERCFKTGFWSENPSWFQEKIRYDWTSFENYLQEQERLGHTNNLRTYWFKECKF